ncbi:MAG TPA: 50S ribosomal protein L9 [Dehalococcoidales bacterium]|nr:50S ribosomal protein L9 [Dehalococcoidales bacterium]
MQVVFLQDVPNVAKAGEVKEIADGYGRNFLIPRKLALLVDSAAMAMAEKQLKVEAQRQVEADAEVMKLAHRLEGREVILKARVGAKDQLYGSITSADIASELQNGARLVVDKRKIELAEPIRQLGSYEVAIKLAKDVIPKVRVTVTAEEKD